MRAKLELLSQDKVTGLIPAWSIFFPGFDDNHCDRIHVCLTTVPFFEDGYVEKQLVVWKEHFAEYWLKELLKSMDSCTGMCDIIEIMLKSALNNIQSIRLMNLNEECSNMNASMHLRFDLS